MTNIFGVTKKLIINNKKRILFSIIGVTLSISLLIGMANIFYKMEQGEIKEARERIGETDFWLDILLLIINFSIKKP